MSFSDRHLQECSQQIPFPTLSKDGFAVLKEFLDQSEVGQIGELVQTAMSGPHNSNCARSHNTLIPLRWNDSIVQRVVLSECRLQALRDASNGDDLRWISGYISSKEPLSPPLWWHQDWWCWNHPVSYRCKPVQIALLCYLTDTTVSNGALRVLPGSHLASAAIHAILPETHSQDAETLESGNTVMSDLSEQVALELKAGDAVVLDYRLLHGTHANATAIRRDCVLLSFTPLWCQLPPEIRAHLIGHAALPVADEAAQASLIFANLLPTFAGEPRNLQLNRNAPSHFKALEADVVSPH